MIDFEHIDKTYQESETVVFRDFTEHIERGEFVLVTGQSGSGKSTLFNMLLLDVYPDAGHIYINERDIHRVQPKGLPEYRRNFGVIFQNFRLVKYLTVKENIEMAILAVDAPRRGSAKKIFHVAKMLGITDLLNRYPNEISGGQQQKVCLARAIVNNPPILLADEPTANLDPEYSREMKKLFDVIHNQGTTLFVVTQDQILTENTRARIIELTPSESHMDTTALFSGGPITENIIDRTGHFIDEKAPEWVKNFTIGRLDDNDDFWD